MASILLYPSLGKRIHYSSLHGNIKFRHSTRLIDHLRNLFMTRDPLRLAPSTPPKAPPSPRTPTIPTTSNLQRYQDRRLCQVVLASSTSNRQILQRLAHTPRHLPQRDSPRISWTTTLLTSPTIFLFPQMAHHSIKPSILNISARFREQFKHLISNRTPCCMAAQTTSRRPVEATSTISKMLFRSNRRRMHQN